MQKFLWVLLVVFFCSCSGSSNEEIRQARIQANEIIQALENFHNDNDSYPGSLHELIPEYVEGTADLTVGKIEIKYIKEDDDRFVIWFEEDPTSALSPAHIYSSPGSEWNIDSH